MSTKIRHSLRGKEKSLESSAMGLNPEQSMKELNSAVSAQPPAEGEEQAENAEEQEEDAEAGEETKIPDDHYLLGYGPVTVQMLQKAIDSSFKLFWDGSVGMYIDTVIASRNNLDVLDTLLEMRTRTNEDEEPPVTLLHGQETEKVLRQSLMRIKIEQ